MGLIAESGDMFQWIGPGEQVSFGIVCHEDLRAIRTDDLVEIVGLIKLLFRYPAKGIV